ncbi:MAG: tetratricopeptide repeat protein [Spartobacteria bacterium]
MFKNKILLPGVLIAIFLACSASAAAGDFQKPPGRDELEAIFQEGFAPSATRLESQFAQSYKPSSIGLSLNSETANFTAWLDLWRWCKLFAELSPEVAAKHIESGLARELLSDPVLSRMFFSTLSEKDAVPQVLDNLGAIRAAHPQKFREYVGLAIAIALVNDVPPPQGWPHHQVAAELVPASILPVERQFSRWVSANEARQLLLDPRKLSPSQLKFVVDAFITDDELAWARKNVRLTRSTFEKAYFQINYSHERLQAQQYDWSMGPYTLAAIRKQGGICVDQAYYASMSGKALGLPTLFFTGQGSDGGHAWFGYMRSDDQWELDCGRYSQHNYATGEALDPQTWEPISDHELELLAARFRDKPEFAASMNTMAMAEILEKSGDPARAGQAYEKAIQLCPRNADAWSATSAFLQRQGAPAKERISFHERAKTQFTNQADLKVLHQQALISIYQEQGDSDSVKRIEQQILSQNKSRRSDLSVNMAAEQLQALIAAGNMTEAEKLFRRQVHSLSQTGGGNFFYDVAAPYIRALLEKGDKNEARRSIDLLRRKLAPQPGGILDVSLAELAAAAK